MEPVQLLRPRRRIQGVSAILLPFQEDGEVAWESFEAHVARTAQCGLTPAVNMDTGYVNLLDVDMRGEVLQRTQRVLGGKPFVAGAFVCGREGDDFQVDEYLRQMEMIQAAGGTPVIFQSHGLTHGTGEEIGARYAVLGERGGAFIGFELGQVFAPFGKVYDLATYRMLLENPHCLGAKHSSLHRDAEWDRLKLRDEVRPDFHVYTGNDLAIDMVMYGSDYLLGLSTFAPDLFALRDAFWESGDADFYELNDVLQYLGFFGFRDPVPAYKHSAAYFLHLRGWIPTPLTHPASPARSSYEADVMRTLLNQLGGWIERASERFGLG